MSNFLDKLLESNIMLPISILVAGVVIAGAIIVTNNNLAASPSVIGGSAVGAPSPSAQPAPTPQPGSLTVRVSTDDDAVLGDVNAPVTVIEFSDYECPFCKRSFQQMSPLLKEEYIDSGKVKFVFRDLPLDFHNPLATQEAIAAECAREQGGDEVYYKYHDELFNRTTSNGNGLTLDQLNTIATDLGLNGGNFNSCLDSQKYLSEVQKDLADGAAAGANGTPTYFIGKSTSDGVIEGTKIVGAQPFAVLKVEIDRLLQE